ncbi:hypothetical protein [Streptomyces sp. NPDC047869]|uniref:hypothetical protein n=1 Tax=Streptomyces sp. NPDC047869 TaxID=3154709 RepID=UPI003455816D
MAGLDGLTVRLRSQTGRMQTIMLTVLLADDSFRASVEPPSRTLEGERVGVGSGRPVCWRDWMKAPGNLLESVTGYRSGDALTPEPGEPRTPYNPADPALTQRARGTIT